MRRYSKLLREVSILFIGLLFVILLSYFTGMYKSNVRIAELDKASIKYLTDGSFQMALWSDANDKEISNDFIIKWWFAGVVCFFVNMGLGMVVSTEDLLLLDGIVLGLVVDVLVNPLLHFMETDRREYNNYMMFPFPFKAYWTFFTNVLYYVGIALLVNVLYNIINEFMFNLSIEPLSWALIVLVVDMAFIGIKDLVVYLVKKHKKERFTDV